jgi:hypothetical protein
LRSGTADARAVARGLKEKEYHDTLRNAFSFIAIVIAAVVGFAFESWWIFGGVLLALCVPIAWWYYRE